MDFTQDLPRIQKFIETEQYGTLYNYENINIPILLSYNIFRCGKLNITDPKLVTHILCNSDKKDFKKFINCNLHNVKIFQDYIDTEMKKCKFFDLIDFVLTIWEELLNKSEYCFDTIKPESIFEPLKEFYDCCDNDTENLESGTTYKEKVYLDNIIERLQYIIIEACEITIKNINWFVDATEEARLHQICVCIKSLLTIDQTLGNDILAGIGELNFGNFTRCKKLVFNEFKKYELTL